MNAEPAQTEQCAAPLARALPADTNDFDALTRLAAQCCDAPLAGISMVRGDRVWFLAAQGLQLASVERDAAFEPHVFSAPDATLVVDNTMADARFAAHPLVTHAPHVRFYAGASVLAADGQALGCLSVMDCVPRTISPRQYDALRTLARQISAQFALRRLQTDFAQATATRDELQEKLKSYQSRLDDALVRLNTESTIDALTGLPNRRAFEARLDEESDRARRYDLPVSLLLLEVDRVVRLQATRGHDGANELLQRLAQHLRRGLRQSDMLSRFSPDGFAVILPNTGFDGCCALAERMGNSAASAPWAAPHDLTLSIGMSSQASAGAHSAALIAEANQALAIAKQAGDRRVHFTHIV